MFCRLFHFFFGWKICACDFQKWKVKTCDFRRVEAEISTSTLIGKIPPRSQHGRSATVGILRVITRPLGGQIDGSNQTPARGGCGPPAAPRPLEEEEEEFIRIQRIL
jgi:hypothetical protein